MCATIYKKYNFFQNSLFFRWNASFKENIKNKTRVSWRSTVSTCFIFFTNMSKFSDLGGSWVPRHGVETPALPPWKRVCSFFTLPLGTWDAAFYIQKEETCYMKSCISCVDVLPKTQDKPQRLELSGAGWNGRGPKGHKFFIILQCENRKEALRWPTYHVEISSWRKDWEGPG